MQSNTAILIFSRLPQEEILHKKISSDKVADLAVWQHLYERTFNAAERTGLPIIACREQEQHGKNFAEKITNAINSAFSKGYENLIVLGADCAQLSQKHIDLAYTQLRAGKEIVAGRDMRGGIYMLGLKRHAFNSRRFLSFNWQTNKLFKDIAAYAGSFSFAAIASVLKDINTAKDIAKLVHFIEVKAVLKLLINRCFKTAAKKQAAFSENISSTLFAYHCILRGPPSLL